MQFLVIAHDGADADAPARREGARAAHLAGAEKLKAEGRILVGGPILDDSGAMVGSAVVTEFPSRAELDAWLAQDPYVTQGVWRDIVVYPFRVTV